jgi:hypothetical protein
VEAAPRSGGGGQLGGCLWAHQQCGSAKLLAGSAAVRLPSSKERLYEQPAREELVKLMAQVGRHSGSERLALYVDPAACLPGFQAAKPKELLLVGGSRWQGS